MLVWLLLAGIYYVSLGYPLLRYKGMQTIPCKKWNLTVVLLIYLLIGVLIYWVISNEQFVYYWDYGKYYQQALDLKNMYHTDAFHVLEHVYTTSVLSDYGAWIPSIIALPLRFTQCRFVDYIMLIYVMFAVPAAFSLSLLGTDLFGGGNKYFFTACNVMILLMPWFLQPMLAGYPGLAAFGPIACSIWIFIKSSGLHKIEKADVVVLSAALISAALLRRYFCFYLPGFLFGGIGYSIYDWWMNKLGKAEIQKYVTGYLKVGVVSILVLILFFNGFIQRVLFVDYSEMYTAYNVGDMLSKYSGLLRHLGVLLFVLLFFAAIVIIVRNKQYIPLLVFCIIFEITATVCFFHVQSPGVHHYWIFLVPLLLLFMSLLGNIMNSFSKSICILICACFIYNTAYVFFGSSLIMLNPYICQRDRYIQRQRTDIGELEKLTGYLQGIQEDKKIYCLASSRILNEDILRKLYLPDESPLNLSKVAHVDLRDGFPVSFFESDIVITTNPVQTHLQEGTQQVITILQKELTDEHSQIAEHFEKADTFQLSDGVEAVVYLKTDEFTTDDISYLKTLYDRSYGEWQDLFQNRFEEYLRRG